MLKLVNVSKDYFVDNKPTRVLSSLNLEFRDKEFVAILGPSGSGKTTLLNIIGGLDQYSSGDIQINGVSTKDYQDYDWDTYRNHQIGFVFQNYNLISHLNIIDNVSLALTLVGISLKERKRRAIEILTRVGLQDHLYKKPNQLSGGQQQRVSIARALINNPKIILADEPTGALDSETSIEFMELLKEISEDKLIIMVTHNISLAKKYSNRIVSLFDGKIVDDSNPFIEEKIVKETNKIVKTAMAYSSALLLSFKNLTTKKLRTFITALAGSIGIIGIALTLSFKNGFDIYMSEMENDNFVNMPIDISKSDRDFNILLNLPHYIKVINAIAGYKTPTLTVQNDLASFEEYARTVIEPQAKSVVYSYDYDYDFRVYNPINDKRVSRTSSLVQASKIKDDDIETQFEIVAEIELDYEYQAYIFVNNYNRVENAVLEYLGLPLDRDIEYSEVLGYELRIENNKTGEKVPFFITKIVTSKSQFSTTTTAVYYNNVLQDYLIENIVTKKVNKISIYSDNLENKALIKNLIRDYNEGVEEAQYITYFDNVEVAANFAGILTKSMTIVLVIFSAISLFVSSIMISIITYASVLERTKEIGVLRSMGARKKDVSRVFNAETIILGFFAGGIGIIFTLIITPPINKLLERFIEYSDLAKLNPVHGILLIAISSFLTFLAGLIPSKIAVNKNPVEALRSE